MSKNAWSPKIVAFLCTWCSYAGADLAGTGRNQYAPNIRVIRIPCSGRINPIYIIKALLEGADGVMVSGCHPGDCHYLVGNYHARRRFVALKKLLTTAGIEPDRVQFTWVSASEGARFADVVNEVTKKVAALGPGKIFKSESSSDTLHIGSIPEIGQHTNTQSPASAPETRDTRHPTGTFDYKEQQKELISICKKLLDDKAVDCIIGYQKGGETGLSLPYIITSPEDASSLIWNNRCVPTLSGYLLDNKEEKLKTAIVSKPCDARAIICLIKESQIKREGVYIIGLKCGGMTDIDGNMLPCCSDCQTRTPPLYDALIDEPEAEKDSHEQHSSDNDKNTPEQQAIDKNNNSGQQEAEETYDRFINEMEKCILCYSCRQSCYGCYCKTCFIERGEPDWQPASPDIGAKILYHLGRTVHLSGRCVECGACENACASGVNIRYLIKAVTHFIEENYEYKAGMELEAEPAMLTYKSDDSEIGFLGFDCEKSVKPNSSDGIVK